MLDWFYLCKDGQGNASLKVPPNLEAQLAEEFRRANDIRGVGLGAAIVVLQRRIAALESQNRPGPPESTRPQPAKGKLSAGKRLGRRDRCRFGYRVSRSDDTKLLPDVEEQETIRLAHVEAARGMSLREICRRLDGLGRGRRGKKWEGSHSVLRVILRREGRVPSPG